MSLLSRDHYTTLTIGGVPRDMRVEWVEKREPTTPKGYSRYVRAVYFAYPCCDGGKLPDSINRCKCQNDFIDAVQEDDWDRLMAELWKPREHPYDKPSDPPAPLNESEAA